MPTDPGVPSLNQPPIWEALRELYRLAQQGNQKRFHSVVIPLGTGFLYSVRL